MVLYRCAGASAACENMGKTTLWLVGIELAMLLGPLRDDERELASVAAPFAAGDRLDDLLIELYRESDGDVSWLLFNDHSGNI